MSNSLNQFFYKNLIFYFLLDLNCHRIQKKDFRLDLIKTVFGIKYINRR
jgi:hypothetical protein